MGFKERMGLEAPRVAVQIDELDAETRIELWNTLHANALQLALRALPGTGEMSTYTLQTVWRVVYRQPVDEFPGRSEVLVQLKADLITAEWDDVLELIEDFAGVLTRVQLNDIAHKFMDEINEVFARLLVGYRFVSGRILPVTNGTEVDEISDVVRGGGPAGKHLARAIDLLSDRQRPQYAKVVHESINAVEAKVAQMTGKKVLSEGLRVLDQKGFRTHTALRDGWTKLYGYSSDAGGIRHAALDDSEVDEPLALYFLVSCSAFVNFLTKVESAAKT